MPNGDTSNWYTGTPADAFGAMGGTPPPASTPPPATPPPAAAPAAPRSRVAVGPYGTPTSIVPRVEGMTDDDHNFLGMVPYYESGNQNIRNYAYNDDPRKGQVRTAQGYFQITNTNWNRYAPRLGIKAPNAMAASLEDQTRVALALLKDSGEQNWTVYNPRLAYARQTGMRARPVTTELATAGVSPTARTSLGLDGAARPGVDGAVVPASYVSGMWPPVPGAGGPPGGAPAAPPPTGPPGWLTSAVGPTAANAIGSAPASTMGQGGTGFLGGLTSMLSNPLAQAALKGYFTAISAPRNTSPFGRIGLGGLGALEGLNQAQMQQELLPIMRERAQAQALGAQALAQYRQGQALGPERILAANQATAAAWRSLATQTSDPIEQQNLLAAADAAEQNASKQLDYNAPFKAGQTIAGTQKTQVQATEVEPARAAELRTRAQLDQALAGDVPFRSAKEAADAAVAQAKVANLLPAQRTAAIANARDKFGKQYDAQQSVFQRLGHFFTGAPDRETYIDQQMKAAGLDSGAPGPGPAPTGPSAPLAPPPGTPSGLPGAPGGAPTPGAGGQKYFSPDGTQYWQDGVTYDARTGKPVTPPTGTESAGAGGGAPTGGG